jgi:hypothetical protein
MTMLGVWMTAGPTAGLAAGSGTLDGAVYLDMDGDSVFGPAEPGLAGIRVTLGGAGGTRTALTDEHGLYHFADLPDGSYEVTIDPGSQWSAVGLPDYRGLPVAGTTLAEVNFGLRRAQPAVTAARSEAAGAAAGPTAAPSALRDGPAAAYAGLSPVLGAALSLLSESEAEPDAPPAATGETTDRSPSAPPAVGGAGVAAVATPRTAATGPVIPAAFPELGEEVAAAEAGGRTDGPAETAGMATLPRTGLRDWPETGGLAALAMLLLGGCGLVGRVVEQRHASHP